MADRRRPDPLTLIAGLIVLAVAAMALTGWIPAVDPRWLVAGVAVLAGLLLLISTLRPRAGRRR